VLAGFLLAVAHAGAQTKFVEPAGDVRAAVEREVLETNARMTAAANRLDADAFFAFILDSDRGLIVQNGVRFRSRGEALAAVKRGFAGVAKMDRRFENLQVTVISSHCALLTAEGATTATLDDGRMLDSRFAVSLVFVRSGADWRLLHGHYSMPTGAGR
jgi:ketosteroid isomerase-like protein